MKKAPTDLPTDLPTSAAPKKKKFITKSRSDSTRGSSKKKARLSTIQPKKLIAKKHELRERARCAKFSGLKKKKKSPVLVSDSTRGSSKKKHELRDRAPYFRSVSAA